MATTIRVTADPVWSDPAIKGLEISDTEWNLNVDRYQDFIREAAGIDPTNGISVSDCYRIGNRFQALVEEYKRDDEWGPALVEEYPDVESLEEFLWMARFFQNCHKCNEPGEMCFTPDSPKDTFVPTK